MHVLIRKSAVFYLLLLVLLKVLAAPAICLHYQLNKAYIAANLCENRDKPVMHCGGKCHLRKQLAKTADNTGQQTQKVNAPLLLPDFCESIKEYSFNPDRTVSHSFQTCHITNTDKGHSGNVFHPPIA